jgi:hypothetical protein
MNGEQPVKTLQEEVRNATDDKVNADRLSEHTTSKRIDAELNAFPLHVHQAIVNSLQVKLNLRQQSMSIAAAEYQRQHAMQEEQNRKLAFEQAKVARVGNSYPTTPEVVIPS